MKIKHELAVTCGILSITVYGVLYLILGARGAITATNLPLQAGNSSTVHKSAGGSVGKVKLPYTNF
jgi:hypothetical protein